MADTIEVAEAAQRSNALQDRLKRVIRGTTHFLAYHFVLKRRRTITAKAAGFSLVVPPTVFHPRYFLTSEYFAGFIDKLRLHGYRVADVGTGTGIIGLAAARAGADSVVALDINPNAAWAAERNASRNGQSARLRAVCSDLFSALAPQPLFDVIFSNPPYFPGEAIDLADRAWHAGDNYRLLARLFDQARARLKPNGVFYVLLSSGGELTLIESMMESAGFRARRVAERFILIESLIIYELRPH
ncbi:MAG: methyltransferase [Xanthobacteraceae bacterium]